MPSSAADRPLSPAGRPIAETVGFGVWLLAAIGWGFWIWHGYPEFGPAHLAMGAGLVLTLAVLARRGWVVLFGPVLLYEGIRSARRSRFFFLRWIYAGCLLLLLLWIHSIWSWQTQSQQVIQASASQPLNKDQARQAEELRASMSRRVYEDQARLAEQFFYAFAIVQFVVVVLLTPAYVAGGIAEEKERRTLEFLLATDLGSREIVFGKLLARLGNLGLFVITGLPVLSLMQFFGGIDPGLLLASFEVTALTALSLGGLGILLSVQRRRARDAIILTYLAAFGYVAISSAAWAVPPIIEANSQMPGPARSVGRSNAPQDFEWLWDTVQWINAGNPISGLVQVVIEFERGRSVNDKLNEIMERYALFHGVFAIGCVALAMVRLRPVALAQAGAAPRIKRRFRLIRFRRPPVGRLPMVWKEVRIEGGLRFGWFGKILIALVIFISFIPLGFIVYEIFLNVDYSLRHYATAWDELGQGVNAWLRFMNVIISTLMLLGVAVRAAGAFGSERDRDTLISLMTTPLTTKEIFWAKVIGSLISVRMFFIWLSVIWAIALVTGGVGFLAVPAQVVLWLIPALFVTAMGMFFSAACKTTLRAITWTIFGTLFAVGGHWVCMGMCCYAPLAAAVSHTAGDQSLEWLVEFEGALSPPFLFAMLPYRELNEFKSLDAKFPALLIAAQVLWLFAAAVIGHLAHAKFRQITNRQEWERGQPRPLPPQLPPQNPPTVLPVDDEP
jgi:ABC-type transport system involved in multi-copper enzyme maturation permease subunit